MNEEVARFLAQRPRADLPDKSTADLEQSAEQYDDSPMDWDDYGLIDELTAESIKNIDSALMSLVKTEPRTVRYIVSHTMEYSPARVPGLPDYYYLERVRFLVESGALHLLGDIDELISCKVYVP